MQPKYIHVQLACTLHTYANTYIHFYHSRRREISHSHLTPSHSEHKKNGCSSAREQVTFSLTAAHKRTSTGLVSMTRADLARHTTASKPLASSEEALAALAQVCTALMVAIGWLESLSLERLCSTTASTVGYR